jgi:Ser/Thr protein kinase RdoA (MazF antagonist)
VNESARELEFVASRRRQLEDDFLALQQSGLPTRITHNDTKLNNVLFDPNGKALCLIDLDTVMPGYVQYDFGDAVRSGCRRAEEDDRPPRDAGIDLDYLRALATGYFREARAFLEVSELEYFAMSPRLLTFIMGVRFLTDHIHGDVYYRTAYAGHNLVRARNQLALVRSMETNREAMAAVLAKSWRGDA